MPEFRDEILFTNEEVKALTKLNGTTPLLFSDKKTSYEELICEKEMLSNVLKKGDLSSQFLNSSSPYRRYRDELCNRITEADTGEIISNNVKIVDKIPTRMTHFDK